MAVPSTSSSRVSCCTRHEAPLSPSGDPDGAETSMALPYAFTLARSVPPCRRPSFILQRAHASTVGGPPASMRQIGHRTTCGQEMANGSACRLTQSIAEMRLKVASRDRPDLRRPHLAPFGDGRHDARTRAKARASRFPGRTLAVTRVAVVRRNDRHGLVRLRQGETRRAGAPPASASETRGPVDAQEGCHVSCSPV